MQRSRAGSSSSGKVHDHLLLVTNREQSCSENEPTVRENVVREMDTSKDLAELPARGRRCITFPPNNEVVKLLLEVQGMVFWTLYNFT